MNVRYPLLIRPKLFEICLDNRGIRISARIIGTTVQQSVFQAKISGCLTVKTVRFRAILSDLK